ATSCQNGDLFAFCRRQLIVDNRIRDRYRGACDSTADADHLEKTQKPGYATLHNYLPFKRYDFFNVIVSSINTASISSLLCMNNRLREQFSSTERPSSWAFAFQKPDDRIALTRGDQLEVPGLGFRVSSFWFLVFGF